MTNPVDPQNEALYILFCTITQDKAPDIARTLVEERLVACVNVVSGLTSYYYWEGKLCKDEECLLVIKTRQSKVDACLKRIPEIHPYDVPEIIAFPADNVHPPYMNWLMEQTK